MKVRDVMETEVITVPEHASYEDVAKILYTRNISGVPVVDKDGNLVGALSEKDLFRIMYPFYKSYYEDPGSYTDLEARENKIEEIRSHPVKGFMTQNVVTVAPDMPVMRAGALMLARGVNRLPVVEDGKLIGIISRRNIFREILRHHLDLH